MVYEEPRWSGVFRFIPEFPELELEFIAMNCMGGTL